MCLFCVEHHLSHFLLPVQRMRLYFIFSDFRFITHHGFTLIITSIVLLYFHASFPLFSLSSSSSSSFVVVLGVETAVLSPLERRSGHLTRACSRLKYTEKTTKPASCHTMISRTVNSQSAIRALCTLLKALKDCEERLLYCGSLRSMTLDGT